MDERTTSVRPRATQAVQARMTAGTVASENATAGTAAAENAADAQGASPAHGADALPFAALDNPDDMPYEGQLAELEPAGEDPVEFRQIAPDDHD